MNDAGESAGSVANDSMSQGSFGGGKEGKMKKEITIMNRGKTLFLALALAGAALSSLHAGG